MIGMKDVQKYVASCAITASALRNQGAPGLVRTARDYCAEIDLDALGKIDTSEYLRWLENRTQSLMKVKEFDVKNPWGPARKAINIFMVVASLNRILWEAYKLEQFENALEVPLDGGVGGELCRYAKQRKLLRDGERLRWETIKMLSPDKSARLQEIAQEMAKERGIPRGQLDILLWRPLD